MQLEPRPAPPGSPSIFEGKWDKEFIAEVACKNWEIYLFTLYWLWYIFTNFKDDVTPTATIATVWTSKFISKYTWKCDTPITTWTTSCNHLLLVYEWTGLWNLFKKQCLKKFSKFDSSFTYHFPVAFSLSSYDWHWRRGGCTAPFFIGGGGCGSFVDGKY